MFLQAGAVVLITCIPLVGIGLGPYIVAYSVDFGGKGWR